MTNEEILKKAIEKVESNGYKFYSVRPEFIELHEDELIWKYKSSPYSYYAGVYETIFSHSFAKAFWGEKLVDKTEIYGYFEEPDGDYKSITMGIPIWMRHLQQMVTSENPIKYLEAFI